MRAGLSGGHDLRLLVGARALFPAMVEAIDAAQHSVHLETYIFDPRGQAQALVEALARAARRGVRVRVLVDGVGTGHVPAAVAALWFDAGVQWEVFSPLGRWGLLLPSGWRRLHRKLCVVDAQQAFCGGINVLDDWLEPGQAPLLKPRLDYAVQVIGPLVADVQSSMQRLWWRAVAAQRLRDADWSAALRAVRASGPPFGRQPRAGRSRAGALAQFLERDNLRHRRRIERSYLRAIGRARHDVLLAHAYFVPGRRMRKALRQAVARGVRVQVLLQSRYENFMQHHAAQPVHHALMRAGVALYAYRASALHGKVAVIDGVWATVGSSNLDPLSLLLAREANVVVHDLNFAQGLRQHLLQAITVDSQRLDPVRWAQRPWRERLLDRVAFGLMRVALFLTGQRY